MNIFKGISRREIWMPIIGIPIGFSLAFWFFGKAQEWVTYYQIKPIVAFLCLNAIGIVAVYLGAKALGWAYARRVTDLTGQQQLKRWTS